MTKRSTSIGSGGGGASRRSSSAILEGVGGFDTRRLLGPIGNVPPAEAKAEARCFARTDAQTLAA